MQTRVFNPGPDDFVTRDGRLWPALTERNLDPDTDPKVARAVARGRLTDLGPATPTAPQGRKAATPTTPENGDA